MRSRSALPSAYCASIIGSRRPSTASSSRNCADSKPLEVPEPVPEPGELGRRHGLQHVELRHHDLQDGQRPAQRAHGVRRLAGLQLGLQPAELVQQLLEPQLVDLVDDDEQHLVVLGRPGLLRREHLVQPQVTGVGDGLGHGWRTVPGDPFGDEVAGGLGGVPHVGEARGERGQAEPEPVRGAVVGDDALLGQPRHDPLGFGMAEADVAAAPAGLPRRGDRAAERDQPGVGELDQVGGQPHALGPDRLDARLEQQPRALLHRRGARDRRRAGHELGHARRRVVPGPHGELVTLGEPAPDRLAAARPAAGPRRTRTPGRPAPR